VGEPESHTMAVCGLDCGSCEIRLAPENPEAARIVVAWFQEMGWLDESEGIAEVIEREMYCTGCRGDRSVHWSPDCPLLICCVDEKHLEHCAQCDEFVCEKLEAFATDGQTRHREAVERLRKIAESRQ
jgi:hypothetical protein